MKINKETKLYTINELSDMFGIPNSTLRVRCLHKGFFPQTYNGKHQYMLTDKQAKEILDKKTQKAHTVDVIYCHTIWEIRESKLNFM